MTGTDDVRWGRLTARTSCRACGQPVPLPWPAERTTCPHCHSDEVVPHAQWADLIRELDEHSERGASREGTIWGARELAYTLEPIEPRCERCGVALSVEALEVGVSRNFACTTCGDPACAAPAPGWLRRAVGPATQIVGVEPRAELGGDLAPGPDQGQLAPIVMSCPRCGGGLEIGAGSQRVLGCRFCQAEVYAPDEVWRRLHPVKRFEPFYVRFEGASLARRRREGEARAERERADRARKEREREQQEQEEQDAVRHRAAAAAASRGFVAALAHLAALAGAAAYAWTSASAGGIPVGVLVAGGLAALFATVVTCALVTRPIAIATQLPGEWLLFATWFWLPFALAMPAVGQVMALVRVVVLARGHFGSATIESNGSSSHYAEVWLAHGEGRPAALFFLTLALVWPLVVFPAIAPEDAAAALRSIVAG